MKKITYVKYFTLILLCFFIVSCFHSASSSDNSVSLELQLSYSEYADGVVIVSATPINLGVLILVFVLVGLRLNIQISSIKKLKENENLRRLGVDNILFFIPEFTPIKYFMNELGVDINEELQIYFHKIRLYRVLFLITVLLFVLAFIFFQ